VLSNLVIDPSANLLRTALGDSNREFLMEFHRCLPSLAPHFTRHFQNGSSTARRLPFRRPEPVNRRAHVCL